VIWSSPAPSGRCLHLEDCLQFDNRSMQTLPRRPPRSAARAQDRQPGASRRSSPTSSRAAEILREDLSCRARASQGRRGGAAAHYRRRPRPRSRRQARGGGRSRTMSSFECEAAAARPRPRSAGPLGRIARVAVGATAFATGGGESLPIPRGAGRGRRGRTPRRTSRPPTPPTPTASLRPRAPRRAVATARRS
jgi:hypothetical protein